MIAGTGGQTPSSGGASTGGTGATVGTDAGGQHYDFAPIDGGTIAMSEISFQVPAFSSNANAADAKNANDSDNTTLWASDAVPGWLAYDLSSASSDERQSAMVALYAGKSSDYISTTPPSYALLPEDYVLEINSAPGGSSPPDSNWTQVASVTGNVRAARDHMINLNGANWLRISVSKSSDPTSAGFDMDVYSTPHGPTDDWLFIGDSITHISLPYAFSDLPSLVHKARADRRPAIIEDGIGGENTQSALAAFDDSVLDYPGLFIVLALGTNDHPAGFQMEALVQKVLALGRIPVVPHIPWSAMNLQEGPQINQLIDALYAKYPEILKGPDLWAAFENRTDLIPANDIHPNSAGQEVLRQQWATMLAAVP